VFFFDEAHLLFDDMPKELVDRIVQVVKLVRSKGVGVYFITQSPSDIPDEVLAQLSTACSTALRAYTPAEQKAVRAAAASFREEPRLRLGAGAPGPGHRRGAGLSSGRGGQAVRG
jgi:DNA helicase HerA-like ATPase